MCPRVSSGATPMPLSHARQHTRARRWGVGVLAYTLLCGAQPFEDDAAIQGDPLAFTHPVWAQVGLTGRTPHSSYLQPGCLGGRGRVGVDKGQQRGEGGRGGGRRILCPAPSLIINLTPCADSAAAWAALCPVLRCSLCVSVRITLTLRASCVVPGERGRV